MLWRDRLWLTHRKKRDEDFCPLCFSPIKWVYDGLFWIPCDKEPVFAYIGYGEKTAVYKKELCKNVHLYRDGQIEGIRPSEVLIPHVFTCSEIKKR